MRPLFPSTPCACTQDIDDDIIERTSPNLRSLLGLSNPAEDGEKKEGVWRPPMFSGLQNSKPVVTLSALAVGKEKGLEIKYKKTTTTPGDGDADEEEDWDSDEEGWDFEGAVSPVEDASFLSM